MIIVERSHAVASADVCLLGKTIELARLHLETVVIVDDVVIGLEAAVVEVLILVDARVVVMGVRRARDAGAAVVAGHVVPYGVYESTREELELSAAAESEPAERLGCSPTMTPTPAAWQVEIMLANWSRSPRLEVRMYETGW